MPTRRFSLLVGLIVAVVGTRGAGGQDTAAHPPPSRAAWTNSRVTGSPDPPPPYRTQRLFPDLTFDKPVDLCLGPGGERWFVVEQGGKIYSFPAAGDAAKADLFIDLNTQVQTLGLVPAARGVGGSYGIVFHPKFHENRYCYVFYILASKKPGEQLDNGTRISRFTVIPDGPPRIDPDSEVILLEWRDGGHNGGCLKFGPDGYLYISAGDSEVPSPPDPLKAGQDVTNLLSAILRIDVDRAEGGRPYAIPSDNPFIELPGARPEIWSYGYRNPWRMSFDRLTGELWVGDVGWETWELVYRVQRGGNYGWSIFEGPQPIDPQGPRGPTPILAPTIAIAHPLAASVTGGYVYRGARLPRLAGHYILGDWETRLIWANRVEGEQVGERLDIARTDLRIISFAEDQAGELYILDYEGGGIHQLVPGESGAANAAFPVKLSDTGLFDSVRGHVLSPGIVRYEVCAAPWADGAGTERFIAVPGHQRVELRDTTFTFGQGKVVTFPKDTVLGKTFSLGGRRIETQVLHFDGRAWNGYSYAWDENESDGHLVEANGAMRIVPTGGPRQMWRFPPRNQCSVCHNPWAGVLLGYNEPQLDRPGQLRELADRGVAPPQWAQSSAAGQIASLVDPHDAQTPLENRARSYLHANCAHCHQFGGGGAAVIDLRYAAKPDEMRTDGAAPIQGHFGIRGGQVIAPGEPYRSVLFYRMARLGPGRMPHVGSEVIDLRGLELIEQWIASLGTASTPRAPADASTTSTEGALALVRAIDRGELGGAARQEAIARGVEHPNDAIRGLFVRFAPPEPRDDVLGDSLDSKKLLSMAGDAQRGRGVFFESPAAATCRTCHGPQARGTTLGPDLSHIGIKYSRAELLEQILEPSRRVDEPFVLHIIEMDDGGYRNGFVAHRDEREIVLRDLSGQEMRLKRDRIRKLEAQHVSTMPPLLLRSFTAQEAADLLSFLESLRSR